MTKAIKDFSLSLTESIHAALEAEAEANDTTMQIEARKVLSAWAEKKAHAYMVYFKRIRSNNVQPEFPGFGTESDGKVQKGGK